MPVTRPVAERPAAAAGAPLSIARMRAGLRIGLALALAAAAAWLAHAAVLQRSLQGLHEAARQRLEVEAARLDAQLSRFQVLPALLETSPEVLRLLSSPADLALRESASRYLKTLNAMAGADNLYVLDTAGVTLAAADFDRPGTPLGQDLSYRPYMKDALAKGRGAFYGVGITSARAGYYLSYGLRAGAGVRGVATVKVDLHALEQEWGELPGELLVLDEQQVVILSTRDAWRYRPLAPLAPDVRAEAERSRRYGSAALAPLRWREGARVDAQAARVRVDGAPYLMTGRPANGGAWRLVLLDNETPARAAALLAAVSAALGAAVLLLLSALAAQRRREVRERLASREALQQAHDSLEVKVQERTAELKSAQQELVHAGRLALLGQMSAGLVHELNQPLAALNTLSDNAALLIERGRVDEARGNLARIGQLVNRLGRLTSQLKVFAHKSNETRPVAVLKSVQDALLLVGPRLREAGIETSVQVEPGTLAVAADEARLEQVLVNLLANAADALEGAPVRRIEIRAALQDDGKAAIVVRNTGPGIDPDILPRLFEPFVTSKPPGKGLGLGLMMSAHIVRAFGGSVRAANLAPAGVEFTIELPTA